MKKKIHGKICNLLFILFLSMSFMPLHASAQKPIAGSSVQLPAASQMATIFYKTSIDKIISVDISGLKLETALRQVAEKSGMRLTYRGDVISDKKVTLVSKKITVTNALNYLLKGLPLDYKFSRSRYLIIYPKKTTLEKAIADSVKGTVTDAQSNETLPGVNISIKGTTKGTFTDASGHFSLDVPSTSDSLIVSFVGYATKTVAINGQTTINIELLPQIFSGDELVVVGYGQQRKISLIGAQSSIQNVSKLKIGTPNLTNGLAGRLSGVVGVQRSGLPGSDASDIFIRGISTFNSSGPLILVDGIERSMNSLNPDDIKSLTILKDASATAVYGTRGANGVILIKTKRGTQGKPSVSVNYFEGVTALTQIPKLADGPTFMRLANEASTTRGGNPIYTEDQIQKTASGENPLLYPNVDWIHSIFNDYGHNRQMNANVSGGNDLARYRVSLSWYNEKGLLSNSDTTSYNTNSIYNKYNLSSNVTVDITPTTHANLGVGGFLDDKNYPSQGVGAIYGSALEVNPVVYPLIYPGGRVPGRNANGGLRNPYADATTRGYSDDFKSQLFTNLDLTQDFDMITPGLSLHGLFGFDTSTENQVIRDKRLNTYYLNPLDPYDVDGSYNYNLTYEGQNFLGYSNNQLAGPANDPNGRKVYIQGDVNYDRTFLDKHHVTGLLHYSQSDFQNVLAGDLTTSIPHREESFAGRATYSYDDRYFVEVNAGYTGSENFAPDNRFGFFPSAGVGWVLSNEKFWDSISNAIQFFKVRYSDGFVGASGSPGRRFAFLTLLGQGAAGYTYGLNNDFGRGGIDISDIGVNVRWARSRKQDLGLEIHTLQNDLSLTIDFFKEDRDGIFLRRASLPNFVGLNQDPLGNFGEIVNKGLDGQIQYNSQLSNDFNLSVQGQFTYNRDKIIDNDQPPQPYPYLDHRGNNRLAVYGYQAEGFFKDQADVDSHARQFGTVLPGDIKYKDLNGDGVINGFDRTKIGRGDVPYLTVGLGLNLRYKAFDLQSFFQGQFGADRQIGGTGIQPFFGDGGRGNVFAAATDRWTVENPDPNAAYPRLGYGAAENTNNYQTSSFWERKIDFVRLRVLEFGYTLPVTVTQNTSVSSARIYFRGRNLATVSNFHLWDPELNTGNGTRYPNTKVFSIGFDLKF